MWLTKVLITTLLVLSLPVKSGEFIFQAGGLSGQTDSSAEFGMPILGAKMKLDAEKHLTLPEKVISPYLEVTYKLDNNHAFFIDWRSLHRKASQTYISKNVDVLGHNLQAMVDTDISLNLDIARIGYAHNLFENDKWRFDGLIGLHIMNIKTSGNIDATMTIDGQEHSKSLTSPGESKLAPLPNVGIKARYNITPNLTISSHLQAFMVSTYTLDGFLSDASIGLDYKVTKDFSVHANYNYYSISADYGDSLLNANLELSFSGPMLAVSYAF
ncbi:MAG: DUF481 domain-containing protein [Psychromonas sp.]